MIDVPATGKGTEFMPRGREASRVMEFWTIVGSGCGDGGDGTLRASPLHTSSSSSGHVDLVQSLVQRRQQRGLQLVFCVRIRGAFRRELVVLVLEVMRITAADASGRRGGGGAGGAVLLGDFKVLRWPVTNQFHLTYAALG